MKLRVLNLGDMEGLDYFSYADYPLVNDIGDDIWLVIGRISDSHFSVGSNRNIDDYLKDDVDRSKYTFSRYLEPGGIMWYKDVLVFKVIFNKIYLHCGESIVARVMHILKHILNETPIIKGNYIYLNDKKVAGYSCVYKINEKSVVHVCVDLVDIPVSIRGVYKNKTFDEVGSLENKISYTDFVTYLIEGISERFSVDVDYISKTDLDISSLININKSKKWIESGERDDLER